MTTPIAKEAVRELCEFTRVTIGADLVLVLKIGPTGRARAVASSPVHRLPTFNVAQDGILGGTLTQAGRIVATDGVTLPSAVIHAMAQRPTALCFIPLAVTDAPGSGLLILWSHPPVESVALHHVHLLASSFARILVAHDEARRQGAMRDQFNDLLESVPSGILLFDGDGQRATANEHAARLLECRPGTHRAGDLAAPMRALRERCSNAQELQAAYAAHVGDVNYSGTMHWVLGAQTYEVDTHPVNGEGQYGRIWLFTDVTAELQVAATLRDLAQSDPLTGVANRRHFEEQATQLLALAKAAGRVVTLMMLDADHFKRINDTHGHLAGDEVLRTLAARWHAVLRDRDLIGRFGGEEFIVLVATATRDEAVRIAERLRSEVANTPIMIDGEPVTITVSIGAATETMADGVPMTTLKVLTARADAALYRAKSNGRNNVVTC